MLKGVRSPNHLQGGRAFLSITSRLDVMKEVVVALQGARQIHNTFIQKH
ncbi:hypothetical protein OU5_5816 [Pseudomonas mandelii JR-1]|jgi:hypothetical protein|uniref:Uncharacterized protein n=1 Tax=Pseudomonas mandelii JR-1 TaxID=1147786 RepID=A0A024EK09_9PSED|nr:hypothetical protein OU5_5816 [Pseudomonas mandelii JR-1]